MLVVLVVSGVQHVDCITFSTLSFFLCVKRKEKEKERERGRGRGKGRGRGRRRRERGRNIEKETETEKEKDGSRHPPHAELAIWNSRPGILQDRYI